MLPRREFLACLGTGAAGLAVAHARAASASPAAETLSLGCGLYGMKTTPVAEAIDHCARIGYRNLEFTVYPGYATDPGVFSQADRRAVRGQVRRLGLSVSCLKARPDTGAEPTARKLGLEKVVAAAQLALDLDSAKPPLLAVHAGGRSADWEKLRDFIADQMGAWSDAASKLGVPFALKGHVGNAVDRPERLLWLLARIPGLTVVYDHSHFSLLDLKFEECLDALSPRLAMIQVKDARHTPEGKHEFLLPGDGGFDYVRYFRKLDQIGFVGPVVLEVSAHVFNRPGYDPVAAAQRSYQVLARALAARKKA